MFFNNMLYHKSYYLFLINTTIKKDKSSTELRSFTIVHVNMSRWLDGIVQYNSRWWEIKVQHLSSYYLFFYQYSNFQYYYLIFLVFFTIKERKSKIIYRDFYSCKNSNKLNLKNKNFFNLCKMTIFIQFCNKIKSWIFCVAKTKDIREKRKGIFMLYSYLIQSVSRRYIFGVRERINCKRTVILPFPEHAMRLYWTD